MSCLIFEFHFHVPLCLMLIRFVVKGVELLIAEFESDGPTDGFMSVTIALLFFFTVYVLEMVGKGVWFRPWIRGFLGDYAYPVSPIQSFQRHSHIHQPSYLTLPFDRSPHSSGRDSPISLASCARRTSANCLTRGLFIPQSIEAGLSISGTWISSGSSSLYQLDFS